MNFALIALYSVWWQLVKETWNVGKSNEEIYSVCAPAVEICQVFTIILFCRLVAVVYQLVACWVVWLCAGARLVSEKTIEENILKKANEKRLLGSVAIEGGNFTTAFFRQVGR